ncbi:MAG: hypothetical protein R3330_02410 [Saprospiraceae bacterium]|nr:hypothetical protein [Saprospiraceae bacterium]
MRRSLFKVFLLLALILGINALIHLCAPVGLGNSDFQARWHHFRSMADDITAVYVGSSRIMRHIDPSIADSIMRQCDQGPFRSYNLGASGVNLFRNAYVTRALLRLPEAQRPAHIFLEIAHSIGVQDRNVGSSGASFYVNTRTLTDVIRGYLHSGESPPDLALTGRYVKQWLFRTVHAGYGRALLIWDYPFKATRGFTGVSEHLNRPWLLEERQAHLENRNVFEEELAGYDEAFYRRMDTAELPPCHVYVELLKRLEEEAAGKGVKIIHVHNVRQSADLLSFAIYRALPDPNKVSLHRFHEIPYFRSFEAWYDPTHLDPKGARLCSEYLAREVCDRDLIR